MNRPTAEAAANAPKSLFAWIPWQIRRVGGQGVTVAVIDSGVAPRTAGLSLAEGVSIVDDGAGGYRAAPGAVDELGHGTACATIIGQLAPRARILPVRVFERSLEAGPAQVACAIRWAAQSGADVVNISLGTHEEWAVRCLYSACADAAAQGSLLVASGDNQRGWCYPAAFDMVLSATGDVSRGGFSLHWFPERAVEYYLRGMPAWCDGRLFSGSVSFAAATLSGLVALLAATEARPVPPAQMRRLLAGLADPPLDTTRET